MCAHSQELRTQKSPVLFKPSRMALVPERILVVMFAIIAVSAANLLTHRKHFEPSCVSKEHILAHLDDHLPVLAGESFTMSDIDTINEHHLAHDLDAVVKADFFSIFKADINSPCTYGAVYAQCALEGGCDITDSSICPFQHHRIWCFVVVHPHCRQHSRRMARVRPKPIQARAS